MGTFESVVIIGTCTGFQCPPANLPAQRPVAWVIQVFRSTPPVFITQRLVEAVDLENAGIRPPNVRAALRMAPGVDGNRLRVFQNGPDETVSLDTRPELRVPVRSINYLALTLY